MDVSLDKVKTPTLFDLVAPRNPPEAASTSFRDCLGSCVPATTPAAAKSQERNSNSSTQQTRNRSSEIHREERTDRKPSQSKKSTASAAPVAETKSKEKKTKEKDAPEEKANLAGAAIASTIPPQKQTAAIVADEETNEASVKSAKLQLELSGEGSAEAQTDATEELVAGENLESETFALEPAEVEAEESNVPAKQTTSAGKEGSEPTLAESGSVRDAIDGPSKVDDEGAKAIKVEQVAESQRTTSITSEALEDIESEEREQSAANLDGNESATNLDTAEIVASEMKSATPNEAPPSTSAAGVEASGIVNPAASTPRPPHALLKSTAAAERGSNTSEIDPARFLHRVAKAFESAHQRDGEVRLRLHPAELGSLTIEVKIHEGTLTARIQAETSEARTALVDNLPQLRERLAEQGIRIEQFDVDLYDQTDRQGPQTRDEAEQRRNSTPNSRLMVNPINSEVARESPAFRSGDKGLNVVV